MQKVQRAEVVDFETYSERRDAIRAAVLEEKQVRRVHLGDNLTFLFETTNTIRYQVQEMMRIERIVREKDIQHEIDTYNELLGDTGELGCTLLIEIDDPAERATKLAAWLDLPKYLYLVLDNGERAPARWDQRQVGSDRVSSVQYLKFRVGQAKPVAIGSSHPQLRIEQELSPEQSAALAADAAAS